MYEKNGIACNDGTHGQHNINNDNGRILIDIGCSEKYDNGRIQFEHKDIRYATWTLSDGYSK